MNTNYVFFGTSRFSVIFCEELKNKYGITPTLVVTALDRPVGRKQIVTPPPMKIWAEKNNINTFQPENLKDKEFLTELKNYKLFVVASYGKIIPQVILDIPTLGTVNIHPSLLPKYRGASPIQTQIINDEKNIGTTIMLMDPEMDHGNIVAQKEIPLPAVDTYTNIEEKLALESASLFASIIESFIDRKITTYEQNHTEATFTKIIKKADGEIKLDEDARKNYLKYLAYHEWPKTFFYTKTPEGQKRTIITQASFKGGEFIIEKVIPEGSKEQNYFPPR